jgi:glycosyltransferase involved in cell wall biosynthesis
MSNLWLIGLAFCCAGVPAVLWVWNMLLYCEPGAGSCEEMGNCVLPDAISVLIPARNAERVIGASLDSLLASRGVQIEIIVLDDGSTDRTAEIVLDFAARDSRVRLESAPPLPGGWNGKQYACHTLAAMAHSNILCFLDADVRLAPEALVSMSAFLVRSGSDLVSGFPRQETETPLEWLLLPLVQFVLLSYLPLARMRALSGPGFAIGCSQFLMMRRDAYRESGGHAQIRKAMYDGLLLPRLFRRHGLRTDIADLSHLATCRMYHNASEVWRGLAKNATDGMASPARILPFTFLLFCGQILPLLLALSLLFTPGSYSSFGFWLILAALAASFVPRLLSVWKYRQPLLSACLHPLGVAVLLTIQWYALLRKIAGQQTTWKERAYPAG